mmetsp:Transcript_11075/g.30568  ORF Transcript_11075/g.30568 Transcript_11075/m.30568 type:complete len:204 (-) Transcript_11075:161-772(-)
MAFSAERPVEFAATLDQDLGPAPMDLTSVQTRLDSDTDVLPFLLLPSLVTAVESVGDSGLEKEFCKVASLHSLTMFFEENSAMSNDGRALEFQSVAAGSVRPGRGDVAAGVHDSACDSALRIECATSEATSLRGAKDDIIAPLALCEDGSLPTLGIATVPLFRNGGYSPRVSLLDGRSYSGKRRSNMTRVLRKWRFWQCLARR